LRLAERLGASTATLSGQRATAEILAYARQHNVSKIVVGKPSHPRWRDLLRGSKLEEVVRGSADIDVYVISGSGEEEPVRARLTPLLRASSPPRAYLLAAGLIALATVIALATRATLGPANLAMVYLLAVVAAANWFGRGPSILASVLSVASFDFFCVPPYQTFAVSDTEYVSPSA
jgi:two-component system sensor histidine kinase KdpD